MLDVYLVLLKGLESSPFKHIAKQLREQLEHQVEEERVDFQGNKHPRDLNSYIARIPNGKYLNKLIFKHWKTLLQSHDVPTVYRRPNINMYHRIRDRMLHGTTSHNKTIPIEFYNSFNFCMRSMGHLAPVYCTCFDQTGQFIFTGADDNLIKIWCARTFKLLRTLRGHTGEICDMSVNYENRLLASAGTDKIIRIWDLKSTKLLECLSSHHAVITSVRFAPYNKAGSDRYLVSTSNDGTIVLWKYHVDDFGFQLWFRRQERNRIRGQITCSSFSTGGSFLACGSSDNCIHVYGFEVTNPYWIVELNQHTDSVDSIQFCNYGYRFVSGSKDGTAIIWNHRNNKFKPLVLNLHTQLDQMVHKRQITRGKEKPLTALFVQWTRDDRYVITALSDASLKVWESKTGKLVYILREHESDVFHIESHPHDPRVFVSAGHDGNFCIWDINTGKAIKKIQNYIDPRNPQLPETPPKIYDIKFSPDGTTLATTDSLGYLTVYRMGSHTLHDVPDQMFFSTDYAHMIHDVQHFVMDEATHMAPHLLPAPYLVDMNGTVYPDEFQPLVPDYQHGQRPVVPELRPNQRAAIDNVIRNHSDYEDALYTKNRQQPHGENYDSDATIVDSDATEIDESYQLDMRQQSTSGRHNLRSRSRMNSHVVAVNVGDDVSRRMGTLRARRSPRRKRLRRSLYSYD